MALIKLFNRTETITRTTSQGFIDADENLVAGDTVDIVIECNIQAYREGKSSFNNPTGFRTTDALKIYSTTELFAADEFTDTVGDTIVYLGKSYFCKDLERWDPQTQNGTSLIPEHYLGYFYRSDHI